MRISNSNDLGKLLQQKFGGKLIIDTLDNIQITNVSKIPRKEIEKVIKDYYIKTLKCISHPEVPSFENQRDYEAVTLSYFPNQNQILITIIEMGKQPTSQPSSQ